EMHGNAFRDGRQAESRPPCIVHSPDIFVANSILSSLRGAKRRSNPVCLRGGILDCFAEPVIGPRFARTRWLAMTERQRAAPHSFKSYRYDFDTICQPSASFIATR